jgi:hypothetical protein
MVCCYNIALKSPEERASINRDLVTSGVVHKFKKGELTRRHIEVMIYDTPEPERELFKARINHYMTVTRETKGSGKVKNQR